MFKKINNYKIILIKNNSLDMKEYSFPLFLFLIFSIILSCVTTFFISLYSTDLSKLISLYEIRKHKKNNIVLEEQVLNQKSTIDDLINELAIIKAKDENLRKLVKLPKIDDDTRKLGIGGDKDNKIFNDLNYLLPTEIEINDIDRNLNFIKRTINLETYSYEQIETSVKENLDYILRYPAIHPVSLDNSNLSSRYGYRKDPFSKRRKFHKGDDFSAKIGTDVLATANGRVKTSRKYGSFGNYIEIEHGNGYKTVFGHLNKRFVKVGDIVERGQVIGEVGNTGRSTAPHLHYEVLFRNKQIDPSEYYFELRF